MLFVSSQIHGKQANLKFVDKNENFTAHRCFLIPQSFKWCKNHFKIFWKKISNRDFSHQNLKRNRRQGTPVTQNRYNLIFWLPQDILNVQLQFFCLLFESLRSPEWFEVIVFGFFKVFFFEKKKMLHYCIVPSNCFECFSNGSTFPHLYEVIKIRMTKFRNSFRIIFFCPYFRTILKMKQRSIGCFYKRFYWLFFNQYQYLLYYQGFVLAPPNSREPLGSWVTFLSKFLKAIFLGHKRQG